MPSQLANELIQTLDEEIDALKNPKGRNKGGSIVKVFNGRLLRDISGLSVYVFNLESFLTTLDDSPAEIEINGFKYHAQILLTQGLEVEIGIEGFSGNFVSEATLYTNLWYLLEALKKKLEEKSNSTKNSDFNLSEGLFLGKLSGEYSLNQKEISYTLGAEPPNDAQKKAIKAAFSSKLSIIWGPPGTGKTKTIARIVEAHLNAGRSVLIVSHANNAVDEALEDIAVHLKSSSFYQEGKLVRLGKPQEEHLKNMEGNYPMVLLDRIVEQLGIALSQEKHTLEHEKAQIEKTLLDIDNLSIALKKVETLVGELDSIKASLSQVLNKVETIKKELLSIDDIQARNKRMLLAAQSYGTLKRFMTGLYPDNVQHMIDKTSVRRDSIARTLESNMELAKELKNTFQAKEVELNESRVKVNNSAYGNAITLIELKERKSKQETRKEVILSRIAEIKKELEDIQKNILIEAKLVATTLTKTCTDKQLPNRKFDVLILDEASMAPLPHLYWAAGLSCNSIVIVGDFLQLPPICVSEQLMAQKWLARSIFDILEITTITKAQSDERVMLLDTQYRMVPAISEISNRFIYQGILKDHLSTARINLNDGISSSPLVLIETGNMNVWCSQLSSGGRFNLYNALVCATLARNIIQKNPDYKIGIITPYRAQARLINKIAKDWQILDSLSVNTIYTFQGGEQQIIIFDTTEGEGLKTAPMLDDTKQDSDALKVLNVAITRAKDKFYCIANTKKLFNDLGHKALLSRIISYLQQKAECIKSECLVDNYFTADFEKWADVLLSSKDTIAEPVSGELYTEHNFWDQFLQDIKIVKQRLIILSPFVSIRRSTRFMDLFKAMVDRNVEIKIYTRPISQQVGEMANQSNIVLNQCRSIGVNVIEKRNMHQKVAIIDNDVAWEGSLNILSHRDTGEQMRRFIGQSTIEELIKNLEILKEDAIGIQTRELCPGMDGKGCDNHGFLVVRQNHSKGNRFLGCSSYPKCKYTKPISRGK
jgi:superfamily I DNA and/or RNA helicase